MQLRDPVILVGDFDRPNLFLGVVPRGHIEMQVADYLRQHPGESGIVYCITRHETEALAKWLQGQSFRAAAYHAGLDDQQRAKVQDAFMAGQIDVAVATIAFGMGVDKPNVRFVLHTAMPSSLEIYHQEIGRAGRDGQPAECVLFYLYDDLLDWCEIIWPDEEPLEGEQELDALYEMLVYCEAHLKGPSSGCRRFKLLRHFGQDAPPTCSACDVCMTESPANGKSGPFSVSDKGRAERKFIATKFDHVAVCGR